MTIEQVRVNQAFSSSNLMIPECTAAHFIAETGVDVPAVTADQMREVDRIATEETGPSLLQMMENAGRSLASLAMELMGPHWRTSKVIILAGTGGNGGGGICAGRHLANHGIPVTLCLADPRDMSEAAAIQRRIFQSSGGKELPFEEVENAEAALIIDALIGYGLKAAPRGTTADLIAWAATHGTRILALDVPTGVDATTGQAPGASIHPAWTMTLALPKLGLLPKNSGQLFLADIGIPIAAFRRVVANYIPPYGKRFCVGLRYGSSSRSHADAIHPQPTV